MRRLITHKKNSIAQARKRLMRFSPSQFTETAINLPVKIEGRTKLKPFSFTRGGNFFRTIYNTNAKNLLLMTGRQIGKSTCIGNITLNYSILQQHFRTLFVSPTQQQTEAFSRDKLETIINNSPRLKVFFAGRNTKENVLYKRFATQSDINLRYAYLSADRTRGLTSDMLIIDELQDILVDVIPVIEETLFTSAYKLKKYAGTPKGEDNTIAHYWNTMSTQNEWVIPCDHCGSKVTGRHWNIISAKSIGKKGLICTKCGHSIYSTHPDARWSSMNPNPKGIANPFEGYRIPQIIHPNAQTEDGWLEILDKLESYPTAQFYNEKLGLPYDFGDKPLTKSIIRDNCTTDPARSMNKVGQYATSGRDIYMGIDWGGGGAGDASHTVISLGTYMASKFYLFYVLRLSASDAGPARTMEIVSELVNKFKPKLIGADFGGGYDKNDSLIRRFGINRVVQYQYVPTNKLLTFDAANARYKLNRNSIMGKIINAIKRGDVFEFPPWSEFESPFAEDMINVTAEYSEARKGIVFSKTPSKPDDTLHSLIYCFLASHIMHPRHDVITPMGDGNDLY